MANKQPSQCVHCLEWFPSKIARTRHERHDCKANDYSEAARKAQADVWQSMLEPVQSTGQDEAPAPAAAAAGSVHLSSLMDNESWLRSQSITELLALKAAVNAEVDRQAGALLRSGEMTYREAEGLLGLSKSRLHQIYGRKRPRRSV